jgi:MOSC domain-containing protein YiiM
VGDIRLRGVRLCEPCAHLAKVLTPKVIPALVHKAGLRAQILAGGALRIGDAVVASTR